MVFLKTFVSKPSKTSVFLESLCAWLVKVSGIPVCDCRVCDCPVCDCPVCDCPVCDWPVCDGPVCVTVVRDCRV